MNDPRLEDLSVIDSLRLRWMIAAANYEIERRVKDLNESEQRWVAAFRCADNNYAQAFKEATRGFVMEFNP